MSSSSLAVPEKLEDGGKLILSETPTARNSLDHPEDKEKQAPDTASEEEEDPEPLSRIRLILLMLGLCLAMFLVALDFVC
jgi:hypothetical protein